MAKLTIEGSSTILGKIAREQRLRVSKYCLKLTFSEAAAPKVAPKKKEAPKAVKKDKPKTNNKKQDKNFFGK